MSMSEGFSERSLFGVWRKSPIDPHPGFLSGLVGRISGREKRPRWTKLCSQVAKAPKVCVWIGIFLLPMLLLPSPLHHRPSLPHGARRCPEGTQRTPPETHPLRLVSPTPRKTPTPILSPSCYWRFSRANSTHTTSTSASSSSNTTGGRFAVMHPKTPTAS